ncbi:hypothetical protein PanWU01x14_007260 [Parasponia andersonii]|uniref:Uncharacterized protein n=1 Tax=Parasponia andersonii TaxID=3476 RepID=A0A2P5E411_PARAD|nr:hypothetical protein PanWU01x14_007260 [Parasponia andersonii]
MSLGHISQQTVAESGIPNDSVVGYKKPGQVNGCCLPIKDTPVPFATKIYYSQRNNRLRSALSHLYYEAVASAEEFCRDTVNTNLSNENVYHSQASSQKDTSPHQINSESNGKKDSLSLPSVQNPDQMLAQSSEVCLGTSGVCPPPTLSDFSKQFPVDNVQKSQVAPVGLARNKYLSKPFLFAGNSGQPLGAVQQQNGSVPVL